MKRKRACKSHSRTLSFYLCGSFPRMFNTYLVYLVYSDAYVVYNSVNEMEVAIQVNKNITAFHI